MQYLIRLQSIGLCSSFDEYWSSSRVEINQIYRSMSKCYTTGSNTVVSSVVYVPSIFRLHGCTMSDLTVYAEALIATVARAFYDDDAVCLIDVLIRDKFLRDDDMAPRLQLPAKRLRTILQFLQEEHLVKSEDVDDLAQGGSQATKFWYIDYNHAVHTIRLRLHLLRKDLEETELSARSNSFYLCPGTMGLIMQSSDLIQTLTC
jgi:transcription initiation factor IIE alpha subunit